MPSLTVTLARDLRGRVTAIGTAEAPDRFAAYAYNADGSVGEESLAGGTAVRRMAYDGLGRLTGIDDPAPHARPRLPAGGRCDRTLWRRPHQPGDDDLQGGGLRRHPACAEPSSV